MKFKTVSDMQTDIYANLWKVPATVDLIVGVPRSGMLAASMIALALNRPLTDIGSLCDGRVYQSGSTRIPHQTIPVHALIVDDSSRTGSALNLARSQLEHANVKIRTTFAIVYGTSTTREDVLVFETVNGPRIFEWNVLHHPGILANAMLDIDGVLCHDPATFQNDDGVRYTEFLAKARPLHLPSHPVQALVTSRLEKYRMQTESWLSRYKVKYESLIMLDVKTAAERRETGMHGSHKASHYKQSSATLFVESEADQAIKIANLSGKPVLSLEGPQMLMPNALSPLVLRQAATNHKLLAIKVRALLGDKAADALRGQYRSARDSRARLEDWFSTRKSEI